VTYFLDESFRLIISLFEFNELICELFTMEIKHNDRNKAMKVKVDNFIVYYYEDLIK
jgi:hypothetical protein